MLNQIGLAGMKHCEIYHRKNGQLSKYILKEHVLI